MWLFPPFRLDPLNQRLWKSDVVVGIKPKTLAVLRYLVEHPHRLVSKKELLSALWPDVHVDPGVLKTHMNQIRHLLEDPAKAPKFIETVPGLGYKFVGSLTEPPVPSGHQAGPADHRGASLATNVVVGRESERACLERALERALRGKRQLLFVTGDAGIGKTTLVNGFLAPLENSAVHAVARGQCMEQHGAGEAYLPILEGLSRLARHAGADLLAALQLNAPTWVQHMPGLPGAASVNAHGRPSAGGAPERMLRELAQALPLLTKLRPLVLLIEDLQWSDPSTLAAISYMARQTDPARLLILGTFRPQEVRWTRHPLWEIEQSLAAYQLCEEVALQQLAEPDVARYLDARFPGHCFAHDLVCRLHAQTSGNPLLLKHLVDALAARKFLHDVGGCWQVSAEVPLGMWSMPPSFTAFVARELLRLDAFERDVLEAASVAGTRFRVAVVADALGVDRVGVEELCGRWSRSGRFLRPAPSAEATPPELGYEFIHCLHAQVIEALIPPTRRRQLQTRMRAPREATAQAPRHRALSTPRGSSAGIGSPASTRRRIPC